MNRSKPYRSIESPLFETDVWECSDSHCGCWMRKDMSFVTEPTCPLCRSGMVGSTRLLPKAVTKSY
ncbi:cold-shock protein [Paenibacillus soyae]|uniref:Cold-shock protein n=1 Tax=Paenibacillus soyae TaxID=2969249 RepID=A0A9X2MT72_9BACL|nr:cold-shock protein [Paenibacillus soyae]MCR2805799.1 cold-shock protein [Paenibacillus soyae]